ncbi:MAG: lipocalin family protein [Prevotella sp.]|jgi:hypothetical protein|nr:lipocalin family protein [Prevotella sp.]
MKKVFYFLMMTSLTMTFSSCSDDLTGTSAEEITWGEISGDLTGVWSITSMNSYATSDNVLAQALLPTLIDMLNTTSEAEAYLFDGSGSYSQYWTSDQPNDAETGLYKETGSYVLSERNLTLSYTDGQTGGAETGEYKIVSLSDTQLVLYKDILGTWGDLAASIIAPFDAIGVTPKSAYKLITYTKN